MEASVPAGVALAAADASAHVPPAYMRDRECLEYIGNHDYLLHYLGF